MKFYVYYYINEQGLPYYVGKGCGKRAFARHNYTEVPPKERIKFLITETSEDWALYKEAAFIDRWGTLADGTGTLENTCDKPHPTRTGPHTPETIERIRESNRRAYAAKDDYVPWNKGVSGYSTSWKGRRHKEETKEKLSAAAKGNKRRLGKTHTEESKAKMRKHPGCRSIVYQGVSYPSVSAAARATGKDRKTIRNAINR